MGGLSLQTLLGLVWWDALWPRSYWRAPFFVNPSTSAGWISFLVPDPVFFIETGGAASTGIYRERSWGHVALLGHVGGTGSVALHAATASAITGEAWPEAILMLLSLVTISFLAWTLRRV